MDVSKSPESDDGIPKIASEDEQKAATDDEQRTDDDKQKAEEQDMSSPTETDDVDDETICPVQQKLMTQMMKQIFNQIIFIMGFYNYKILIIFYSFYIQDDTVV